MTHGIDGHATRGSVTPAVAGRVADTMQGLASPTRVLILANLRERPQSVSELIAAVGMQQSAVSHQLRLLRDIGLVVGERHGRRVVYSLHDEHVAALIDQAVWHVEHLQLGATSVAARSAAS
jgi:ArsR family transcriptional regulator, nickel/cobalt-responsive transcriptional repressor